jgi:hypothetical protein
MTIDSGIRSARRRAPRLQVTWLQAPAYVATVILATVLAAAACGGSSPAAPTPPPDTTPGGNLPPTPPPPPPPPPVIYPDAVFVGAGDIGDCNHDGARRTGRLLDGIPGTVFMLGDGAYPRGEAEDYDDCYDPYWGRHRSRTRPVPGNHDYDEPGAPGFLGYFAGQVGDGGRTYYRFQLGAWQVYALDSNIPADASSSQYQWLAAELAQNVSRCTLAYWHHPVRSSSRGGDQDQMQTIWALLADRGADLVLSAHDHVYERFAPMNASFGFDARGMRLLNAGTGGGRFYTFGEPRPLSEVRIEQTWGVLKLTLSNDGYMWEFIPVSGSATDSGADTCN